MPGSKKKLQPFCCLLTNAHFLGCSAPSTSTLTWRTFPPSTSSRSFTIRPESVWTATACRRAKCRKKVSKIFLQTFTSSGPSTDLSSVQQRDRRRRRRSRSGTSRFHRKIQKGWWPELEVQFLFHWLRWSFPLSWV